ncbi:hypothetical protein LJB76_03105, partial [Clostridia bacterium OttesenSCG-928-O13]|nr:hypothetical protein [Clostridia bacterium OttesenSCG-928-O13]
GNYSVSIGMKLNAEVHQYISTLTVVAAPPVPPTPAPAPQPAPTTAQAASVATPAPQTSDSANTPLWALCGVVALAALGLLVRRRLTQH